jgi:acyl transferase domain-containing protein
MTTNRPEKKEWNTGSEDIAIVGMSVNFPLGDSAGAFWESLKNGINTVSEVSNSLSMLLVMRNPDNARYH